jgi:hypothetical protein
MDPRFHAHRVLVLTDANGAFRVQRSMGDRDDGDMARRVAFRPEAVKPACIVRAHHDGYAFT